MTEADDIIARRFPALVPVVRVLNKTDLTGVGASVNRQTAGVAEAEVCEIRLSAKNSEGIDLLRAELLRIAGWQAGTESIYLARERHLIALRAAQDHVSLATDHAQERAQSLDLFAEELRLAQEALNSITGEFTSDDLLGVIFSRFCIGK